MSGGGVGRGERDKVVVDYGQADVRMDFWSHTLRNSSSLGGITFPSSAPVIPCTFWVMQGDGQTWEAGVTAAVCPHMQFQSQPVNNPHYFQGEPYTREQIKAWYSAEGWLCVGREAAIRGALTHPEMWWCLLIHPSDKSYRMKLACHGWVLSGSSILPWESFGCWGLKKKT